jgi:hypothetical protein
VQSPTKWIDDALCAIHNADFRVEFILNRPDLYDEIGSAAYNEWPHMCADYDIHSGEEFRKAWLDKQTADKTVPKSLALVAKSSGKLAGMAFVEADDLKSHMHLTPWVTTLLVLPEYRCGNAVRVLITGGKGVLPSWSKL